MRSLLAFSCVLMGVALFGCSGGPEIVGKWETTGAEQGVTMTFEKDGSAIQKMNIMGMEAETKGKWEIKEDQLTITPSEFNIISLSKELEAVRGQIEQGAKDQGMKPISGPVSFSEDSKTMTFTFNGQSLAFSRVE